MTTARSGTDTTAGSGAAAAARVREATGATYLAFAGAGFAFASWASRIPQVRNHFVLTPASLGLVLLSIAAGSVVGLPLAGVMVGRFGSRRVVTAMAVLLGVGLLTVSAGYLIGLVPVIVGLFLLGFANGVWDVAMNVQGALVERGLGRSIMSRFHAGFSVGTVAGALVGAVMVIVGIPVTAHLAIVAVLVTVAVPVGVQRFLPDTNGDPAAEPTAATTVDQPASGNPVPQSRRSALTAWREPRTILIGVSVLAFAFAEGAGNDWTSVAVIDGYGAPAVVGTLLFAGFLAAMTAGRWVGPGLLDRYGRVGVIRVLAVTATGGLALFVFGTTLLAGIVGVLLWGAGTSLGFPVGMSAAGDDPRHAASRVSVVATIGYLAFLGGPPLIGFLGNHIGVRHGLAVVAVLLGVATLVAGAYRPEIPGRGSATGPKTPPASLAD